MKPDTLSHIV